MGPGSSVERLPSARGVQTYRVHDGGAAAQRLLITGGVSRLRLARLEDGSLASLTFTDHLPAVEADEGGVHVRFARIDPAGWLRISRRPTAAIALSPRPSWEIELDGGVAGLDADLRELVVHSITIRAGISKAKLRLPRPTATLGVRVQSGASDVELQTSAETPVRVQIEGAATDLRVRGERIRAVGHGWSWASPGWEEATNRLDVSFESSVSGLLVAEAAPD